MHDMQCDISFELVCLRKLW